VRKLLYAVLSGHATLGNNISTAAVALPAAKRASTTSGPALKRTDRARCHAFSLVQGLDRPSVGTAYPAGAIDPTRKMQSRKNERIFFIRVMIRKN
jgi:hypothetical protein